MCTHNGPNDQSAIRGNGPAEDDPNTFTRIEQVFCASAGHGVRNGGEQARSNTGHNDSCYMGNDTDDNTADTTQCGADNIQLLAAKSLRPGRKNDGSDHLPKKKAALIS